MGPQGVSFGQARVNLHDLERCAGVLALATCVGSSPQRGERALCASISAVSARRGGSSCTDSNHLPTCKMGGREWRWLRRPPGALSVHVQCGPSSWRLASPGCRDRTAQQHAARRADLALGVRVQIAEADHLRLVSCPTIFLGLLSIHIQVIGGGPSAEGLPLTSKQHSTECLFITFLPCVPKVVGGGLRVLWNRGQHGARDLCARQNHRGVCSARGLAQRRVGCGPRTADGEGRPDLIGFPGTQSQGPPGMAAVNAPPVATTYEYGGAQQGNNPYDTYSQGGGGAYQWPHAQHPAPHQVFVPAGRAATRVPGARVAVRARAVGQGAVCGCRGCVRSPLSARG